MWTLIREQFQYRRRSLIFAAVLIVILGLGGTLALDDTEDAYEAFLAAVLLVAGAANLLHWAVDQQERRQLLWATLPIPRSQIGAARLVGPLLIQIGVLAFCLFGLLFGTLINGGFDEGAADPLMRALLGAEGFVLATIMFVYFHEELMIWGVRWRWGTLLINIASVIFFGGVTFVCLSHFAGFDSWAGILISHVLGSFMGVSAYLLFQRRKEMLIGIDAWTGCPQNWGGGPLR